MTVLCRQRRSALLPESLADISKGVSPAPIILVREFECGIERQWCSALQLSDDFSRGWFRCAISAAAILAQGSDASLSCRFSATSQPRSSPWPHAGGDQGQVGGHACGGHFADCASASSSTGKATSHSSPSMLEQSLALAGALQLGLRRAGAWRRAALVLRPRWAGACPGPRRCLSYTSPSRSWSYSS